jgi:hypothetical protein
LEETAPDLLGLDVEGVVAPQRAPEPWRTSTGSTLDGVAGLERGQLVATGTGLIVANVAGTLLAYRDRCAGCDAAAGAGHPARRHAHVRLVRAAVRPAARRALRQRPRHRAAARSVPLLRNGGPVRVALGA